MNDGALTWRLAGLGTAIKIGRALFARFFQTCHLVPLVTVPPRIMKRDEEALATPYDIISCGRGGRAA